MKLNNSGDTYIYNCGTIIIQVIHKPSAYNRVIEVTKHDIETMLFCFGLSSKESFLDKEAIFIIPYGELLEFDVHKILEIHQYFINEDNNEFDFKELSNTSKEKSSNCTFYSLSKES